MEREIEVLHRRGDLSSHRERRRDSSPRRDEETEAESSRKVVDQNARNDESTDGDEVSTETERDADACNRSLRDGETTADSTRRWRESPFRPREGERERRGVILSRMRDRWAQNRTCVQQEPGLVGLD